MPVREGRAKLWFKTKEEQVSPSPIQDEYDDLMISNIELTSMDDKDDNYTPMFTRSKQETFLAFNSKAKEQIRQVLLPTFRENLSTLTVSSSSMNTNWANAITLSTDIGICSVASSDGPLATCSLEKYPSRNAAAYPQLLRQIISDADCLDYLCFQKGHLQRVQSLLPLDRGRVD